jgi:dipeptidyl aminopeptidase/acylaminoacyl peptidase
MDLPMVKVPEGTDMSTFVMPPALFTQISKDGFFDYQNVQLTDNNNLIVVRSQIVKPSEIYTLNTESGEAEELSFINKNILDQLDLPEMEQRMVKTSDNKEMPTWIILPPNMDKTKKYPVILMCTGGPQGEVSQSYSYRWNFALMASKGYVVVYPGRRGVSGYGQEWTDAVSKDHGGQPERDLLSAIDNISQEPWADKDRLAAVGASYGGYSVFWLAGNHNTRFKAFIAHCGIFDMKSVFNSLQLLLVTSFLWLSIDALTSRNFTNCSV